MAEGLLRMRRRDRGRVVIAAVVLMVQVGRGVERAIGGLQDGPVSAFRLELSSAVETPLVVEQIVDDGAIIQAAAGKAFLILPFRYDPSAGALNIAKGTFRGGDLRGFYGIRMLSVSDGRVSGWGKSEGPVHERLELKPGEAGGRGQAVFKNQLGPRVSEGEKSKQERVRGMPVTIPGGGAGAIIAEVESGVSVIRVDWPRGDREEVNVEFLRRVNRAGGPMSEAEIELERSAALEQLTSGSVAMKSVGIDRLGRLVGLVGSEKRVSWSMSVDGDIFRSAALGDERVRDSAWRYMAGQGAVVTVDSGRAAAIPSSSLNRLASMDSETHRAWVAMVRRYGGEGDRLSPAILGAVMSSGDAAVCSAAVEAMIGLRPGEDWGFLSRASTTALRAVLERIEELPDRSSREGALRAILNVFGPELSGELAEKLRELRLRVASIDDPILARWGRLRGASDRAGYLGVLGAMDLSAIWYRDRFRRLVEEAIGPMADEAVAQAGFSLAVGLGPEPPGAGNFPMLIFSSANDWVVRAVMEAGRRGEGGVREAAIGRLVRWGYSAEAAEVFCSGRASTEERWALLDRLSADDSIGSSDGFASMLGRLLGRGGVIDTERVLGQLNRMVSRRGPEEQWRLLAAVKAGIDVPSLEELGRQSRTPGSIGARRWMKRLGHFSEQDGQRLDGTVGAEQRRACLLLIDLRRGQLVDGEYGMLAVLETCRAGGVDGEIQRWSVPERRTVSLGRVRIELKEEHDEYAVFLGKTKIGEGMVMDRVETIRSPAGFSPALVSVVDERWGCDGQAPSERAAEGAQASAGPLALPSRPVLEGLAPGMMNIEIGGALREAVRREGEISRLEAEGLAPETMAVTMRYAAFGSYYNTGDRRELPDQVVPEGTVHMLNVLVVLERVD